MKRVLLILPLLLVACPMPPSVPKPTPVVVDTDMCEAAEHNLTELCYKDREENGYCCAIVAPTKKGKTFAQFCTDKQNQGVFINPRCLSKISSCLDIDKCNY